MTELSDRIAALSGAQQTLLAKLRRERRQAARAVERIPRSDRPDGASTPLSFAQRRLWFVHEMGAGHVAYSAPVIYRIRGRLDPAVLAESLRRLLIRHPALCTCFPEREGEPVQLVRELTEPVLRTRSVAHEPAADRDRLADELVREEVATPFDLTTGPVVRTTLIELADVDHILVLNIHHITSDQWSMGVLVRELAECYAALADHREPDLPELPITYADFAEWQRDRLRGTALADRIGYWREKLAGMPELDLPADRPRPALPTNNGAESALLLPAELVRGVRTLGETAGTSPFMTLLTAFVGLLARYTGGEDIAVGTTTTGRDDDQLAGLVGFFVNTLVLRVDASGDPTFTELLDRVRAVVLDGHQHADLPFDLLVEHLRPVRDPGRPPLVSIMFQQDNTPDCALRLAGAEVALVDDFDPGTAKYDLLVSVRVWEDTARVHVQYSTDLFDADTIERMLAAYRTLLTAAVATPATRLHALPVLTEQDRRRMLVDWNDTATPLTDDVCLHELFARQATARPDAPAVVAGGVAHGFREIDERANRLAHELLDVGVRPGVLVAVHLPPGVDYLVAVLATLKAGGAFVPVDPDYPRLRIDFILADAAVPVVITTDELAARLTGAAAIVRVTDGRDRPATPPECEVTPDDLGYVIYTSGSTGDPKGVQLRHRGVVNNLADLNDRFGVGPADRVLALSSPSFDMSVYELLGVPSAGGTVVFPEPELLREPAHWADLIADHGITLWNSAPALLTLLLEHVEQTVDAPLGTLRLALVGGDWVPLDMPDRLRALAPQLEFVSLGGATEVSVHSIVHVVDRVDGGWRSIPYGRPMANQRAYILDEHGQPVPVGVPGELHLGGVGVAVGYRNQPALTDRKFVHRLDQRLYRTGDLARWNRDGVIELLGRKDFMVKINGLRVELGEVEAALRRHPAITAAVVLPRDESDGHRQLVAYLTGPSTSELTEVRSYLRDLLPSYMLPSMLVALDAFPLSPNGKVDRRALAEQRAVRDSEGAPPTGPVEKRIAATWCEVLDLTTIGRDDDFFALGGDSFKAVRVARLIDRALPVIAMFRHPTVASLAAYLADADIAEERPLIQLLSPARRRASATLICLPYGGGNAVAYQPLADSMPDTVQVWAVDLPGHDLADPRPLAPIDDVARQCAEEIADRITGPVALYGQCAGTAATLELARRLEDIGVAVTATFMGAALPDPDPERSWRMLTDGTDNQLLQHMRNLGGFDGMLGEQDIADILRVVRHDLTQMVGLYRAEAGRQPRRLAGPVHCVVGADDPATAGFTRRYRDWGAYGTGVTLSVVAGGHYFCKHQPSAVADIIARHLPIPTDQAGKEVGSP